MTLMYTLWMKDITRRLADIICIILMVYIIVATIVGVINLG